MSVLMRDSYKRSDTPEREVTRTGGYTTTTTTYGNPITNIRTGTPERTTYGSSQVIRTSGLRGSQIVGGGTTYTTTTTGLGGYRTSGEYRTSGGYTTSGGYVTRTSQLGGVTTTYPGRTTTTEYSTTRQLSPTTTTINRGVRASQVIGIKEGQSRFLEERYVGERVVNVTTKALEEKIVSTTKPEMKSYIHEVETYEDEPVIQEKVVEKKVEIIVEKKVPVEKYVDVEYEVVVEKPIEKIIEKEIEIEKIMEKEIEKIVEIPIERIVEIPIEKIVEKPVEIEKRVEVPYERVVEKKIEDVYENVIYHDNYLDIDVKDLYK